MAAAKKRQSYVDVKRAIKGHSGVVGGDDNAYLQQKRVSVITGDHSTMTLTQRHLYKQGKFFFLKESPKLNRSMSYARKVFFQKQ